jgi:hypothetical protein
MGIAHHHPNSYAPIPIPPNSMHTLATETALIHFPSCMLSFSNFGSLSHWLRTQCPPSQISEIKKVQWEAHSDADIASAATLFTVRRLYCRNCSMLISWWCRLADRSQTVHQNLKDWKIGLRGEKQGLEVRVNKIDRERWGEQWSIDVNWKGSLRVVDPVQGMGRKGESLGLEHSPSFFPPPFHLRTSS